MKKYIGKILLAVMLFFSLSILFVEAEDQTENQKWRTSCIAYYQNVYAAEKCNGSVQFNTNRSNLPEMKRYSGSHVMATYYDYREATASISSYGSCQKSEWTRYANEFKNGTAGYTSVFGRPYEYISVKQKCNVTGISAACEQSCVSKIESCSNAKADKVEKFCSDSCGVNAFETKTCAMYNASVQQQDVDQCVSYCTQSSGDAIKSDCERVCKNYDEYYAKYSNREGSVCHDVTNDRNQNIASIVTAENHAQIEAINSCTTTCTTDLAPIVLEKAKEIDFKNNVNINSATAESFGKDVCSTACSDASATSIEMGAVCTGDLNVEIDYNKSIKPNLDSYADTAVQNMKDKYGVKENSEDDSPEETHEKPLFDMEINSADGCVIMGSNLNNLLGDIYKWVRGACAALVVIFGILDFFKATTSDDAEAMKKAGSTFIKRIVVLAILVMLPHLIDFVLELMFGDSFKTCLDPFK